MNIVLGAVKGLEIEYISPFLFSLYQSGFDGRVVYFVSDTNERTRRMLEKLRVTILTIEDDTPLAKLPVNTLRYFVYESYLDQCTDQMDNILLADVRDTVFQRDPFEAVPTDFIGCSLEDLRYTLGTSVVNSGWLAAAYGKEALMSLADHPVSCSGATLGPAPLMRAYVKAMTAGLRDLDDRVPNASHVMIGIDQAVHNYLLYSGALPPAQLLNNADGPIFTLNEVLPDDIVFNAEGEVINKLGKPYHILHQYDRHPSLGEHFVRRIENARG